MKSVNAFLILILTCLHYSLAVADTVDTLVADLQTQDPVKQARARQLLPYSGPDAIDKLLPLLAGDKPAVVVNAQRAIQDLAYGASGPGRDADRRAIADRLLKVVGSARPMPEQLFAMRVLERIAPDDLDVKPIAALLQCAEPQLRETARSTLARMATPPAIAALHAALDDADPAFQAAILEALLDTKDPAAVDLARARLDSADAGIRLAALRILAECGDPASVPAFEECVKTATPETRRHVLDAYLRLAQVMEQKDAVDPAVDLYRRMLKLNEPALVQAALVHLGRIGRPEDGKTVLTFLQSDDVGVRRAAAKAAGGFPEQNVAAALIAAYGKAPESEKPVLLLALAAQKRPECVSVLREAANSGQIAVRHTAYRALSDIQMPEARDALAEIAKNPPEGDAPLVLRSLLRALEANMEAEGQDQRFLLGYQRAFQLATDLDDRIRAVRGIAAHPSAQSVNFALQLAADETMKDVAPELLISVAAACHAADKPDETRKVLDALLERDPHIARLEAFAAKAAGLGKPFDIAPLTGAIRKWWVVGPFPARDLAAEWTTDFINEKQVNIQDTYASGGRKLAWKAVESVGYIGMVDLIAHLESASNCYGYAYAEIEVPERQTAVLRAGSDDGLAVWINGAKVHDHFVDRGASPDSDVVPIRLEAGKNTILLKISQGGGGWNFCARLTDRDGRALAFNQ